MSVTLDTSYRSPAEDLALLAPAQPVRVVGPDQAPADNSAGSDARDSIEAESTPAGRPAPRPPATGPHATHLARLHPGQLQNRFTLMQLRRMLRMALGQAADVRLRQDVADTISEFEGKRPPSIEDDHDGEHAFKRYIVLREALEKVGDGPERAAVRNKIHAAIDALIKQHGRRIVGDLHISYSLEKFSADIRDRDQMRKLYHDAVTLHESIGQTFDCMLRAFGDAKLPDAVKTMRHAILEDMRVFHLASADPNRLGVLHSDLLKITIVSSLIASCGLLQRRFPVLTKTRRAAEFTGKVLHITEGPGSQEQVRQICDVLLSDLPGEADSPGSAAVAGAAKEPLEPQLFEQTQATVRQFLKQQVPMEVWKSTAVRAAALGYATPVAGAAAKAA